MWLYMICAVFNIPLAFSSTIAGCSLLPTLLIFTLSSVFRFCWVHKTLTIYAFVADVLINLNKLIGFGSAVLFLKWIMTIAGLIIFLILLFKIDKLTTACPKIKRMFLNNILFIFIFDKYLLFLSIDIKDYF